MAQKHNPESTNAPMTRLGGMSAPEANKRIVRGLAYTAAQFSSENPILQLGELGYETDTHLLKVGDGTTAWNSLPYAGDGNSVTSVNGKTGTVVLNASDVGATAMTVPSTMPELVVANWSDNSQTVSVTGVTATNVVFVAPAPTSAEDYASAGIICTAQGTDSLTFTCTTVPSNAITVNVIIMA